MTRRIWSPV